MNVAVMQTRNPLLNDLAKVAGAALGVAGGMRDELEAQIRSRLDRMLAQMDLVTREEFEAAREMAAKARDQQEDLRGEIDALRAELKALQSGATQKAAPKKKPARKASAKAGAGGKTASSASGDQKN